MEKPELKQISQILAELRTEALKSPTQTTVITLDQINNISLDITIFLAELEAVYRQIAALKED